MTMYLVTVESHDGSWFDDPTGWDTLEQAQVHLSNLKVKGANVYAIYECREIETREAIR